jgi:ribosomal protein S19
MVMRNSNEKLADMTTGMEGTGKHFILNGEEAHKTLLREQQEKFNTTVDEYVDKFDKHNKALEEYANEISNDLNGLEIMPMFGYVLIKPFDNNPFQQVKTTKSGIITDLGGFAPTYKSNETGEIEEEKQFIRVGTVIETGHKCEFVKEGDVVFYTIASECMVPFFKQGFVVVNETRIIAVVNEKLTERKEEIKNGRR